MLRANSFGAWNPVGKSASRYATDFLAASTMVSTLRWIHVGDKGLVVLDASTARKIAGQALHSGPFASLHVPAARAPFVHGPMLMAMLPGMAVAAQGSSFGENTVHAISNPPSGSHGLFHQWSVAGHTQKVVETAINLSNPNSPFALLFRPETLAAFRELDIHDVQTAAEFHDYGKFVPNIDLPEEWMATLRAIGADTSEEKLEAALGFIQGNNSAGIGLSPADLDLILAQENRDHEAGKPSLEKQWKLTYKDHERGSQELMMALKQSLGHFRLDNLVIAVIGQHNPALLKPTVDAVFQALFKGQLDVSLCSPNTDNPRPISYADVQEARETFSKQSRRFLSSIPSEIMASPYHGTLLANLIFSDNASKTDPLIDPVLLRETQVFLTGGIPYLPEDFLSRQITRVGTEYTGWTDKQVTSRTLHNAKLGIYAALAEALITAGHLML